MLPTAGADGRLARGAVGVLPRQERAEAGRSALVHATEGVDAVAVEVAGLDGDDELSGRHVAIVAPIPLPSAPPSLQRIDPAHSRKAGVVAVGGAEIGAVLDSDRRQVGIAGEVAGRAEG